VVPIIVRAGHHDVRIAAVDVTFGSGTAPVRWRRITPVPPVSTPGS
jgi:hypothetical protein